MKDIVMIIHTMGTLKKTDNDRYIYLANLLIGKEDVSIEIVTSDFEHHKKNYRNQEIVKEYPYKITFLHENEYKKNVSIRRILGHYSFARRLKRYLSNRKKPDVIYCAIPPTVSAKVAAAYAKRNSVRFVVDIQDLWPEAFQMVLGKNWVSKIILSPMMKSVDYVYSCADAVVAVSDTYVNRVMSVNRKAKQGASVYLGTDGRIFNEKPTVTVDKPKNEFWIAYVGNLGTSYDFLNVFKALKILSDKGISDIRLLVLGDGNMRVEVEKLVGKYFRNTIIYGYLPYIDMFEYLKKCDIALNPIIKKSVSSVVNKVGDYAAAGIAVVNTQDSEEYRMLLEHYEAGLSTEPENAKDIADKIEILYRDKQLCVKMGENNKKLFEEKFNRTKTYTEIVDMLLDDLD